jgi:hypothetical protein
MEVLYIPQEATGPILMALLLLDAVINAPLGKEKGIPEFGSLHSLRCVRIAVTRFKLGSYITLGAKQTRHLHKLVGVQYQRRINCSASECPPALYDDGPF